MKTTSIIISFFLAVGGTSAFSLSMSSSGFKETTSLDRRTFFHIATAGTAAVVTSASAFVPTSSASEDDPYADFITTESGLKYKVTKEGSEDAAIPSPGQMVKAHYTGWLDGFDSEKKFDSSRDRGRPFSFKVGAGQVIRGWDEAFSTMKVGERRQIVIPSRLGYGDRGAGGIIPGGTSPSPLKNVAAVSAYLPAFVFMFSVCSCFGLPLLFVKFYTL